MVKDLTLKLIEGNKFFAALIKKLISVLINKWVYWNKTDDLTLMNKTDGFAKW